MSQFRDHVRLLRLPLLITAIALALFLLGAYLFHRFKPPAEPVVTEASAPPAELDRIVFYREGDDFGLYFSLYDAAQKEIARPGEVKLKIVLIGTIKVEGSPEFIRETVLLDAKFDVDLSAYRWLQVGEGMFFDRRRLTIPKRIPASVLKKVPPKGSRCKITVEFRDATTPDALVRRDRLLLFP